MFRAESTRAACVLLTCRCVADGDGGLGISIHYASPREPGRVPYGSSLRGQKSICRAINLDARCKLSLIRGSMLGPEYYGLLTRETEVRTRHVLPFGVIHAAMNVFKEKLMSTSPKPVRDSGDLPARG